MRSNRIVFTPIRCSQCDKSFFVYTGRLGVYKNNFCSRECHIVYSRGKSKKKCPLNCTCGKHTSKTPDVIERTRQSMLGRPSPMKGRSHSIETRKLMGQSQSGREQWNTGLTKDTDVRIKNSIPKIQATFLRKYGRADGPRQDTKPERETEAWLKSNGISVFAFSPKSSEIQRPFDEAEKYLRAFKQCPLGGYVVDFYIPDIKLAVFVDGCYWHGCLIHGKNKKNAEAVRIYDRIQNSILELSGYKVVRLWECEINLNKFSRLEEGIECILQNVN